MRNLLLAGVAALACGTPALAQYSGCATRDAEGNCVQGVTAIVGPAASVALAGSVATTGTSVAGPFVPALGRAIWLTTSGTWTGTIRLLRSTDGGATRLPLSAGGRDWGSYSANANEAVVEETVAGATYYLSVTLSGGAISYRVQQ